MKNQIKLEKYNTKIRTNDLCFFYFKWLDDGFDREQFFKQIMII